MGPDQRHDHVQIFLTPQPLPLLPQMPQADCGSRSISMVEEGQLVVARAEFIDDVAAYMDGKAVDSVIDSLNEQHRKFKLVESEARVIFVSVVQRSAMSRCIACTTRAQGALATVQSSIPAPPLYTLQFVQRKARLMSKLPEIQKALDIVNVLIAKAGSPDGMVSLTSSPACILHIQQAASVLLPIMLPPGCSCPLCIPAP